MPPKPPITRKKKAVNSAAQTSRVTSAIVSDADAGSDDEAKKVRIEAEDSEESEEEEASDTGETGWSPSGRNKKVRYVCKGGSKPCGQKIYPQEQKISVMLVGHGSTVSVRGFPLRNLRHCQNFISYGCAWSVGQWSNH